MQNGEVFHAPKARAAKYHLAICTPEMIVSMETEVRAVRKAIRSIARFKVQHFNLVCTKVRKVIEHLMTKKQAASSQGFGEWVCQAIAKGAKQAHRYTTKDAAFPSLPMYERIGERIISDPILLIKERAKRWMALWSKHSDQFDELNETILRTVRNARSGEEYHL